MIGLVLTICKWASVFSIDDVRSREFTKQRILTTGLCGVGLTIMKFIIIMGNLTGINKLQKVMR